MLNPTTLRDALQNLAPRMGGTPDYGRGILVGVVSGLMATGATFESAAKHVRDNLPRRIMANTFPESWRDDIVRDYGLNGDVWEKYAHVA